MPVNLENPDWGMILPHLIVLITALGVSMLDAFLPKEKHFTWITGATLVGFGAALAVLLTQVGDTGSTFHGLFQQDGLTLFLSMVILVAAILSVLISASYVEFLDGHMGTGEFYTLVSFAVLGAMLTASAGDMVMIYVGIELASVATYVLTAFAKRRATSLEGALKYFLLGLFASAILLYGLAWIYGSTATTNLDAVSQSVAQSLSGGDVNTGLLLGLLLVIIGLGFKLAAVPFHFWTPDAYDGAPTPVTGFMSVVPKAAAFAAMVRLLVQGLEGMVDDWRIVIAVLAFVTMIFGNVVALSQRNVKRMLAYSSIAHTGYMLAGVAAYRVAGDGDDRGISAVLYYLLAYAFMNIGAFAVIVWVQHKGGGMELEDFAGLGARAPLVAAAMVVFLVSLMGIPPTIGFYGKYYVIVALLDADLLWLALAIVIASAVSAFFYLRVVATMYFQDSELEAAEPVQNVPTSLLNVGILVMVIGVIVMGVFSSRIINLADDWGNAINVAVALVP